MEVFGGIGEGSHGKLNMERWNRLAVVAGRFFCLIFTGRWIKFWWLMSGVYGSIYLKIVRKEKMYVLIRLFENRFLF